MSDPDRAARLLALTGLDPASLRARLAEPALLAAIVRFLESHEPDLLACAEAIGVPAERIVAAADRLSR